MSLKAKSPSGSASPKPRALMYASFKRPVIEEDALLLVLRQPAQIGDFVRREEAARHVVGQVAADVLDVDANLAADRHRAGDQAVGMRDVEAQVRDAGGAIENFGTAVHVGDERQSAGATAA